MVEAYGNKNSLLQCLLSKANEILLWGYLNGKEGRGDRVTVKSSKNGK